MAVPRGSIFFINCSRRPRIIVRVAVVVSVTVLATPVRQSTEAMDDIYAVSATRTNRRRWIRKITSNILIAETKCHFLIVFLVDKI
ncbi:hypothetical protein BX667DRAFT_502348 [Coemansia mojavensis]|nr:hypothetical protein BX667DRAFT_502348 [Coemansia mojavensis]